MQEIEVFFDGACPLCTREIAFLRRRDREGHILFTDIAAADFSAESYGKTQSHFIDRIRGRLPDGTWVEGVDVFRRLYSAVGLGPLVALTRLPGVTQLLDFGYEKFAKNRLKWTGRCEPDGACTIPSK